jgi:signal transduction histidine kinase/DNA-binding response OmpR family regulator
MKHDREASHDPQRPPSDAAMASQSPRTVVPGNPLPLRLLLRFSDAAREKQFVDHYVLFYHRYAQASLVLGLLLVLGDFLVDHFAHIDGQANLYRVQVCMPLLTMGLAFSFLRTARRHWQPVMAAFIVALALCLFWILLRIDAEGGAGLKTWVGVLNFTFLEFYCFVILGVQFRFAMAAGMLILCAFESAMWAHAGLSAGEVAYWSYHVVTLFMLAAGIGWWREFQLRKEFVARTALDEARESAERLARIKGDFLATMSHEIRTPMNGVMGMNELLIDSDLQPQQRAWAEGVQASGRHLLGVINDILDYSKADSGHMELESVDFALADVVEEALWMFAQPAQIKGLELAAQFEPQVAQLAVRGDPFRLRQVIANLISNAIKFTDQGEVIVRVGLRAQTDCDVSICLSVQDTGIGIAPAAQSRIFEHFAQADGSTTRRYGGTGLGLAICKCLLELMGGSIRVDSTPDRGSTFIAELCLAKVPGVGGTPPAVALPAGVRVLVVDDNHSVRQILQQHLQELALDVTCAADGTVALQLIDEAAQAWRPFALAMLDLHMPQMGGVQLALSIQELPSATAVKVIMMSSSHGSPDPQARQLLDRLPCVCKPVRRADLRRVVLETLATVSPGSQDAPPGVQGRGARLRGHVLLVEDNAINQRVATAMMEKFGLTVTLAVNGVEAVDKALGQGVDLVLMDCQMPVMDGLEATRRIRALEAAAGPGCRMLPIVALTANAMAGDREACAAAGMSDHLSKPFTGASLFLALARHLEPAPSAPGVMPAPTMPADAVAQWRHTVFDASVLAGLPMVADGSEPEYAWSVLEQFAQGSTESIDLCRQAASARDDAGMLRVVHTLKSTSAQVGAMALAASAADLESVLRAGGRPDGEDWTRLHEAHRQALGAIAAHLEQVRSPGARPLAEHCME